MNDQLKEALYSDYHHVEQLLKLCQNQKSFIDFSRLNENFLVAVNVLKGMSELESCALIIKEFLEVQDECLPIYLLSALQSENVLSFPVYLALKPEYVVQLSKEIVIMLLSDSCKNLDFVITLLIPTLVSVCVSNPTIGCPSEKFLSIFQLEYVNKILCSDYSVQIGCKLVKELTNRSGVLFKPFHSFVRGILKHVLYSDCGGFPEFHVAINEHTTLWTRSKTPDHIISFIKQILDCLQVESVIGILADCMKNIDHKKFNCKWLLVVVSTFVSFNSNAAEQLKKNLDWWLKTSVTKKMKNMLMAVLIIIRQCFVESVPPFTSYGTWFNSFISLFDYALDLNFFFNFLSDIVPYEPSIYLKIQINKVPSVPPGAYAALSDYISLAKTRLADLNETTEFIGLFGEYKTSEKESRESDVEKVVCYFRRTGEIMKTLIEASVFRRLYYERVFLTDLLKVEPDVNSPRYKMIQRLHMMGKCPNAMFTDWMIRNENASKKLEMSIDD